MTNRTHTKKKIVVKTPLIYLFCILLWIAIWHITATILSKEVFLPTPGRVFLVLFKELLPSKEFWLSVKTSFLHIGAGFFLGSALGILLAILSYVSKAIRIFLWFPIKIVKSIPVASFVILTLLWCPSRNLSIFISFLMVLPVLYIHTLEGLQQTDKKMLEMGQVFRISILKKIRYIYLPQILPYVCSASSLAIGMAWKSGIAAEIIGLSKDSIGNQLYQSKIYLMTPELFAWTIVIVVLSIACEQLVKGITFLMLGKKGKE
ncbi:MAG: ABC transporter permease subunit [Lachnospiraceae bacterium]|nr:ABC transporter permease subunit [Lachnospiraceae bacterium]